MVILYFFAGNSFLESFGTILERAAYIDDGDMGVVFDDNVWSYWRTTIANGFVGGDRARADSIGEAVNDLVVAGSDCRHVGWAMAQQMWKCLVFFTVATGRGAV